MGHNGMLADSFDDGAQFSRRWRPALMSFFLRWIRHHAEAEGLTQEVCIPGGLYWYVDRREYGVLGLQHRGRILVRRCQRKVLTSRRQAARLSPVSLEAGSAISITFRTNGQWFMKMTLLSLVAVPILLATTPAFADPLADSIRADMPDLIGIYRDLHAHPELSGQETRSAALLAAEARKLGFTVTSGVGGTGVVAVLANGPGPVLLIRADMDALPVSEQTGLAFASKVEAKSSDGSITGVMHACGHDTHMTSWIGTARRLVALKQQWSGTLVMIGQPAEEIGAGARAMIKDGLYTRFPKPDFAIAFHDSASLPAGTIGWGTGYTMANVDSVDILVRGIGGHGAFPHLAKDPIVLASRIVTTLQTLVSRETDPLDAAVVTVGSFQSGTKHNVIPAEARLQITVRSFTPQIRAHLLEGIDRISRGEALAAGLSEDLFPVVHVQPDENTPANLNSDRLSSTLASVFTDRFGPAHVQQIKPQMAGEDFSRYHLADPKIETMLFWVGGVPQARWDAVKGDTTKLPSLHSAKWAPDAEPLIEAAVEAMTTAALSILDKNKPLSIISATENGDKK
jgi:amidohydrolase